MNFTKEECQEESIKYNNRTQFHKESCSYYIVARKNGWLDEICSHIENKINVEGYWTKERCQEISLKYTNKSNFRKNDNYPYVKSYKSGWLDEICSHMEQSDIKPKGYWTKDRCIELSYTCNDRKNFREKYKTVYSICKRNNWLDDIIGVSKKQLKEFWTKEKCQEEALKFEYQKDFTKESSIAFSRARNNGWLDEICSHMKIIGNLYKRCIYVFEFSDNCAYVGLTYDYDDRINKHITKENSAVYQHLDSSLTYITKKLTDYVDVEKAKLLEGKFVDKYEKSGWIILNKIKTGAIGGKLKWTKEKCHEESLKYKTRKEFHKKSSGAHSRARKNGWLNDICSHMIELVKPNGYWTKENCKNEALNYKKHIDFYNFSKGAYERSKKEGWLDEICSHMKYNKYVVKGYWTKENCKNEALKYKTKKDFKKISGSAYSICIKNKWIDDVCSHMIELVKPVGFWTKEKCLEEIKKYNTRTELRKNNPTVYRKSLKNGWLKKA